MDFVMWRKALNTIIARTTTAPSSMGYGYMKKLEVYGLANIKSAKKRIKVIAKKTMRNKMIKSATKTAVKKVITAAQNGNKEEAKALLVMAVKTIDKACTKGVYHKNNASRKKSRLYKMVNKIA